MSCSTDGLAPNAKITCKTSSIINLVRLALSKSANPLTFNQVGQTIAYSYVIENTGTEILTGPFSVTDDKVTVSCTQPAGGTLTHHQTMSCTASYTIAQADLDIGSVTNIATGHGFYGSTPIDSDQDSVTVNFTNPALTLVKSVTETSYITVGDILHYSYLLTNSGNVTLSAPFTITDNKTTNESCPLTATLAPGASITCTASYTIAQADLDTGSVTNIANGHGFSGSTQIDSNQATKTVNATQNPALTLVKSVTETSYITVGDILHYSYLLTNSGNVTLSGPFTITDNKATDESCPSTTTLAPGASITCTASYTIAQPDLDTGFVTNIANGHGFSGITPIDSNQATKTVNATQNPALTLVKSVTETSYFTVGDILHYSYLLTNSGNVTLSGPFTITDNKATDESCPTTATLAPGASITCNATYTIAQPDLDSGFVTNIANGHGFSGITPIDSNQDAVTVNATQSSTLTLVKSVTETSYITVGDILHYSYLLTNSSNVTLSGLFTITDDKATDESCPATATLAPGASITCTASYIIAQADLDTGFVTNIAKGHGFSGSTPIDTNQDAVTVNATQNSALTLVKSVTETSYFTVGDILHYSYLLTNSGNVTLSGPFTITDNKATDESCPTTATLAPGASITCSASYTIAQPDLDAGFVTNIANGHGFFGSTQIDSNQATKTVNATQNPALTLVKSVTETSYITVGDILHYSYLVTNSGNVTLSGTFTITDNKTTNESCPLTATLAPGASITCTASYTIAQPDLDAGFVTNIANGHGFSGSSPIDSNQATKTVNATQNPALTLVKSALETSYITVGDILHYSYLVTNSGNMTINSPFNVVDDKTTNETCPSTPTSLNPGQFITCTSNYTIIVSDMARGSVTNVAHANGKFGVSTVTSNTDTVTIRATQTKTYNYLPSVYKPFPFGIQVLPSTSNYVSHNAMFVIGEVLNNTNDSLTWVQVAVNFFDAGGNLLASKSTYILPVNLPAFDKGCFKISMDVPINWSYYQFEAPTYLKNGASSGLVINSDGGLYTPSSGDYDIIGQVRNSGNQRSNSVGVSGTLYNSSGIPVGCEHINVNSTNLDPGQISSFALKFLGYYRNYSDVANYKLRVAGALP